MKDWKQLQRHPLSAEYADITGKAWEKFIGNLSKNGIVNARKITLHEKQVLDGWQLLRACVELDVEPEFEVLAKDIDPVDFVETVQDHRRHETQEKAMSRADERRQRVANARENGQSIPSIAKAEGVSTTTVQRDLEHVSDDNRRNGLTGVKPSPPDGKVTGSDGVQQPATKPKILCERCSRNVRTGRTAVEPCQMCKEARQASRADKPAKKPKTDKDAPSEVVDAFGTPVPKRCRDAYCDPWIQESIDYLGVLVADFWQKRLADGMGKRKKYYPFFVTKDFVDGCGMAGNTLEQLLDHLKENRPAGVCPACEGSGCPDCKQSGLVPRAEHAKLKKLLGAKK